MEKAKASVKDFLSKSGHHDTTVHEQVAPAVQEETVIPTKHENVTAAVEKETHQDHYHTSVQPVKHQETLPEQHHHNVIPVEHRQVEHDDADKIQRSLANEQAQFKNTSQRQEATHSSSAAPVVAGEHVHHHVHETIQPVVQKQTIEPHVTHTVVPVHETHHNAAKHHAATALPAMSMDDFKNQGGTLMGDKERHDKFEGCPPANIDGGHSSSLSGGAVGGQSNTSNGALGGQTTASNGGQSAATTAASKAMSGSTRDAGVGQTGNGISGSTGSDGPLNSHKHEPTR